MISKSKLKENRFILFLVFSLAVFALNGVALIPEALLPVSPRVSNTTDSSVTISWQTTRPDWGEVMVSSQANPVLRKGEFWFCRWVTRCRVFEDEIAGKTRVHAVTLNNLRPQTPYYYRIISGGRSWRKDSQGQILPSVKTAPVLSSLPMPKPVYSFVYQNEQKKPISGAIVYLTLTDGEDRSLVRSETILTVTGKDGSWILDLGNLRIPDRSEPVQPAEGDLFYIEIRAGDGQQAVGYRQPDLSKELEVFYLNR